MASWAKTDSDWLTTMACTTTPSSTTIFTMMLPLRPSPLPVHSPSRILSTVGSESSLSSFEQDVNAIKPQSVKRAANINSLQFFISFSL